TQVFVNSEGDYYRTRLTHTIEVAQIARTIARTLGLNEDLTEALALVHDIGHGPFGHAGETALAECMREHGGFEHNLHGLRIVATTSARLAEAGVEDVEGVRASKDPLVLFSEAGARRHEEMHRFLYDHFYSHWKVARMQETAKRFLRVVFQYYAENPRTLPPEA